MRTTQLLLAFVVTMLAQVGTRADEPKTAEEFFYRGLEHKRAGKLSEAIAD